MNDNSPVDVLLTYPSDGPRIFSPMMPIGLVSIGTVLKKAGYRVKIIDFNFYGNDFRKELELLKPRIIGIGGTTPSRSGSFLTARIAKEVLPDVNVVYGGINATFTSAETLKSVTEIDYILKGEGEFSFLEFCNVITGKSDKTVEQIPGLCWRTPQGVVENKAERICDLSAIPVADRELLGDNYRLEMEFIGGEGDFLMTSRGCPAACNFCSAARMFPGGVRTRPVDSVMEEVDYLLGRKKLTGLKIFDSTFTANKEHVHDFCKSVKEYKIPWECEIRADTVDKDLLQLMKESGCYYINIGMETSDMKHLKHISKGISPEQVLNVLETCKDLDIRSKVFFTFGHMGQTFSECLKDIRFIQNNRARIDFFAVTVGMRIFPGTRLEREWRKCELNDKKFSWTRSAKSFKNLMIMEPGDIPVLYQKQLGPLKLSAILLILIFRRLVCTEKFLLRMALLNLIGFFKFLQLQFRYTSHRLSRLSGRLRHNL
ncbi:Radical SAM domain protein [Chitinispirillum alkaliphilum]|nr:Radical SAM domain protein [Chitinispirillum alkaliphilum]